MPKGDAAVRRKLLHFWQQRDAGEPVLLDQYSVNNVSFAVAWLAHVLNITPNQLSVFSGLFSLAAFGAALWLPAADHMLPTGSTETAQWGIIAPPYSN